MKTYEVNMAEKKSFGWRKDKYDRRDYLHKPLIPVKELPDAVDLSQFLPEVRDQGQEGSCVGFGIGVNITAWAKRLAIFSEWFSPRDIYNGGKFVGGYLKEEGAYPRDALEWIHEKGCLLEHFWPYVANVDSHRVPPGSLDPERAKYPVLAYYRVDNGTEGIMSALADGYLVSLGSPWFDKWMETDANGNLPTVKASDYVAGGHETCLYGYDKAKKRFSGINSWSIAWGKNGCFTMPFQAFDVMKAIEGYDAHYLLVDWQEVPQPPEPPEPEPKTYGFRFQYTTDGGKSWQSVIEVIL